MNFNQLRFLFGDGKSRQGTRPVSRRNIKQRDAALEAGARARISTLAPELGTKLVVGWNPRMRTTAGVAIASRWEIWLNPALKDISTDEVERTLLHELAHLLAQSRHGHRRLQPHGSEWRDACRDLGIDGEGRTHQLPFQGRAMKRRYRLRCPGCGESHDRVHPPKRSVACLACCRRHHGGKYHERFRLQILKINAS